MYIYERRREALYLYDVPHRRASDESVFILEKLFSRVVAHTLYTDADYVGVYCMVCAVVTKIIHQTAGHDRHT